MAEVVEVVAVFRRVAQVAQVALGVVAQEIIKRLALQVLLTPAEVAEVADLIIPVV
jgi:predicted CoA-binding protein